MTDLTQRIRSKIPGTDTGIDVRKSICTICDPGSQCGLDLYVKDGKIIKVEGSKENPHSQGTLCAKGAATRQYVYHPERIQTPLKRVGPRGSGRFRPISWGEALDTIAERLNTVKTSDGPESVVFYSGNTFYYAPFYKRLSRLFGSPNYITKTSVCHMSMIMSQLLTTGLPADPDIPHTRCLMAWGTNPFHSATFVARHLLDAKDRGLKIITVDPRYSPMAAHADIHLQLRPGTDGALALALAHVMIDEGLYDRPFIHENAYGFDEYRAYVEEFTPTHGETLTGVPADKIRAAARLFATTKPASLLPGSSPATHHTNGLQNHRAISLLVALTGNYDIRGGNFAQPPSFLYVPGGFMTREERFQAPRPLSDMPPRVGDDRFPLWSQLTEDAHAVALPNQIQTGKPYPIKAMLAFGINYRMMPDPNFLADALMQLDFIAINDIFLTDSCKKFADIVIPACTSVERSELRCYPEHYAVYTRPAIKPLFESRSNVDIILDLANRLGIDDPLFTAGYEACLDWMLEPSGLRIDELKKYPAGMPVSDPISFPEKKYRAHGFMTPSKKIEFTSQLLDKHGYDPLPVYQPPKYSPEATPEMARTYPFILNTGSRLPALLGSQTYRMSWTRNIRPEPSADLNPEDGRRLKIKQHDEITITTAQGAITLQANLTNIVLPGVVHVSPSYIDINVNGLLEANYCDPISGFPGYKALLCNVEKAKKETH